MCENRRFLCVLCVAALFIVIFMFYIYTSTEYDPNIRFDSVNKCDEFLFDKVLNMANFDVFQA